MSWYDGNNLIDPNRTQYWTLAKLRDLTRTIVGLLSDYHLDPTRLDEKINHYYQNVFPYDCSPRALDSWYTFNTTASVDTQILPDGVLSLHKPATFDGYDAALTENHVWFASLWPETTTYTATRPTHVLLRGKLLIMRPEPDDVYAFKAPAIIKPAGFVLTSDTPMQDQWGPVIAYGAARLILQERGDLERLAEIEPAFQEAKAAAVFGDSYQDLDQRSIPAW